MSMNVAITKDMIATEAYKFYLAPILFFIYIAVFPYCYANLNFGLCILLAIFPGAFLYSWICFLIHETWHKYVPHIHNQFLFQLYSWFLFADPQVYRICHGYHHTQTHTWNDIEFYPIGYIKNKYLRRIDNCFHFLFGQAYLYHFVFWKACRHPNFSWLQYCKAQCMIAMIYFSCFFISHFIFHVASIHIFITWLLTTIVSGSIQHHSQLIEHWGIIADRPLAERNLMSRNLKADGVIEKIFLFLTHWDSREHVLHHLNPGMYTRPFLNTMPMPSQSVYITFADYLKIAWRIIKN